MKTNLPIRRTKLIQSTALTLIAFCFVAGPALAQEGTEPETIVVTAQKRSTVLLDTAETLTAITGNDLRATGGAGFADLGAQVPSLAYTANFGISQIYIRGVGNSFLARVETPVSHYTAMASIYLTKKRPGSPFSISRGSKCCAGRRVRFMAAMQRAGRSIWSLSDPQKILRAKPL